MFVAYFVNRQANLAHGDLSLEQHFERPQKLSQRVRKCEMYTDLVGLAGEQ